jgi:hypothetical protein
MAERPAAGAAAGPPTQGLEGGLEGEFEGRPGRGSGHASDRGSGQESGQESGQDPARSPRRRDGRRLRDMAIVLPFAFLLLVLPPYVRVFDGDGTLLGVPSLLVYVFGVWTLAILAAGLVARSMLRGELDDAPEPSDAPPGREG